VGEWIYRSIFSRPRHWLQVSGQLHTQATLPPGRSSLCPLDRRFDGPQSGLDDVEKRKFLTLPGLKLRPLGRPARSQSLYRLSYPGSYLTIRSIPTSLFCSVADTEISVWDTERKTPPGRYVVDGIATIKVDIKEMWYVAMDWIHLAQDRS
jgi:hypothetical protein